MVGADTTGSSMSSLTKIFVDPQITVLQNTLQIHTLTNSIEDSLHILFLQILGVDNPVVIGFTGCQVIKFIFSCLL